MDGDVVLVDVSDDLRDEVDEDPLGNVSVVDDVFEVLAN